MTITDEKRHEIITDNHDVGVRVFVSQESAGFKALHWHHHLEIVLVLEGQVTFRFENQEVLLKPNEFVAIGSEVIHSTTNEKNTSLVLQVPVAYLDAYWKNCELLTFNVPYNPSEKASAKYQEIVSCLRQMTQIYVEKQPGYLLRFTGQMMEALYTLITTYSISVAPENVVDQSRIKDLLRYIYEHYDETLTVKGLAERFHYHPDYLSRYFKEQAGLPLTRYLYQLRLQYVYQDLLHGTTAIETIFLQHGITNKKLGMQLFKEQYGTTPFKIRKHAQQSEVRLKSN